MAKIELTPDNKVGVGIYKLDEKSYVYRISVKRNGKRYDTTRKTDKDTEKPFTSKSAAERARAKELYEIELEKKSQRKKSQLMKYSITIFVIQLLIKLKAQLPSNIVLKKPHQGSFW